jgi:hydrogenase maturation factor
LCITRAGKVLSVENSKAKVKLLGDSRIIEDIDVSMIGAKQEAYVEVYANLALRLLSAKEANQKKRVWIEVMRTRNP